MKLPFYTFHWANSVRFTFRVHVFILANLTRFGNEKEIQTKYVTTGLRDMLKTISVWNNKNNNNSSTNVMILALKHNNKYLEEAQENENSHTSRIHSKFWLIGKHSVLK